MNDDGTFTLTLDDDYITSNNTIAIDYSNGDTIAIDTSSWDDSFTTSPTSIYSTGGTNIQGSLTVDGVDVMQSIKDMQRVLGVVSRDIEKEEKYAGLKRAAEAYERELAKLETFETLKDSA